MIGDVLTSSILFEALRKKYPDAELHYLLYRHTFPVVQHNPFIDKFLLFDPSVDEKPAGFASLLKRIRKEKYHAVIDVYAKINTAIISVFSGAKKRISYYKNYTSAAYTHTYKPETRAKTHAGLAIENRMLLLKAISEDFPLQLRPKIYLTEEEKTSAKTLLKKTGISEKKPLFMISILGSSAEKTYPLKYMAHILDFIVSEKEDAQLLFNYIPKQEKEAKQLFDLCTKKTRQRIFLHVYGKSLREFMGITSQCDALIGNEGGAVNMAKALNVPTFSIFSPWIKREAWNAYEDDLNRVVHLMDYKPEAFEGLSSRELKKKGSLLYEAFEPKLMYDKLTGFPSKTYPS